MASQAQAMTKPQSVTKIGINLVKVAAVYMVCGLSLGIVMGVRHDFTLSSVHAHTLMLGWVTMAITGLVYILLPTCADGWLARIHFWGLNTGLPVMMGGLALLSFGKEVGEKFVVPGSLVSMAAVLAFAVNVFRNSSGER